jgi:porin
MKSINQTLYILLFSLCSITLLGQESEEENKKDGSGFGGPNQVDRQLKEDNRPKPSIFELGFMDPYYDFKKNLKENTIFNYGLDYTGAYFWADKSLGYNSAGGGMLRFYGSLNLVGKGEENTGALNFKIEHRHKYGAVVMSAFTSEFGYVGSIEPTFHDEKFRLTNFYWRQKFFDNKLAIIGGLLDAADWLDIYMLASPWLHFTNYVFSTGSATMYIPNDAALGAGFAAYLTDHIYIIASIVDAGSDPTEPIKSFETFFSNNEYFKSVEVGWVSSTERQFFDNIHVTYWNSDGSSVTGAPSGWGLAFSATFLIQDKILPFLRGGYSKDGGTLLQKSIAAGIGYQPDWAGSLLGAAIGWGEANEVTFSPDLDKQITMELFYRVQLSQRVEFTPDVQYLINPALNPDVSSVFVWGLRGRLVL